MAGHALVPDLAGWRRERMAQLPDSHIFDVPPDRVCEVLSPHAARIDRVGKRPIWPAQGVGHLRMVHPEMRSWIGSGTPAAATGFSCGPAGE